MSLNTILISALLLAQSFAITPRRRALRRVDVQKASKLKKELASTKKQKRVAAVREATALTEDIGFAHRYFSTQIDDSRFFFRALAVRGGGEDKPLVTPEKVLSYGGAALLAGMTVYLVEKLPRSGGRAPAQIASFLSTLGVLITSLSEWFAFFSCFAYALAYLPQSSAKTNTI